MDVKKETANATAKGIIGLTSTPETGKIMSLFLQIRVVKQCPPDKRRHCQVAAFYAINFLSLCNVKQMGNKKLANFLKPQVFYV
jgi:hypothetical protein